MKKYIICLFLYLIGFTLPVLSQPNIMISPTTVVYGNALKITFSDDKPIDSLPDLNVLQKDFMIRGQSQSAQTRIINGKKTAEYHLELTVFPRKTGTFDIGPFQWKNEQFPAQIITVNDAPLGVVQGQGVTVQNNGITPKQQIPENAIFKLETLVENPTVYIGETTIYKIRLYDNIGLTQARVEPPLSDDYTLTPYGKEQLGITTIDGQQVQLYERAFLLTPKKTGIVIIPEASVVGSIPDMSARPRRTFGGGMFPDIFDNDPFFNMALGVPQKEVYKQSNPIQLTVKEKPADWQGWWLPAKEVSLTEDYKTTSVVRVGEPIERRIQLSAKGVEGHQLPLLTQSANDSFKVYANPEKRSQIAMNNTIVGYEEITFVIVPTKSGEVNVPSIRINWFNTTTGKKETTELPGRLFIVVPAENEIGMNNNTSSPNVDKSDLTGGDVVSDNSADDTKKLLAENEIKDIKKTETMDNTTKLIVFIGLGVLFALLLGLTGYWLGVRKQVKTLVQTNKKGSKQKQKKKPIPDLYPF